MKSQIDIKQSQLEKRSKIAINELQMNKIYIIKYEVKGLLNENTFRHLSYKNMHFLLLKVKKCSFKNNSL